MWRGCLDGFCAMGSFGGEELREVVEVQMPCAPIINEVAVELGASSL